MLFMAFQLYSVIHGNFSTILIFPSHVSKYISPLPDNVEHLTELYELLLDRFRAPNAAPGLMWISHFNIVRANGTDCRGIVKIKSGPVGCQRWPHTEADLKCAIRHVSSLFLHRKICVVCMHYSRNGTSQFPSGRCVLLGLAFLHEHQFSHNDVAWRNVLLAEPRTPLHPPSYMLIDLDNATQIGSQLASDRVSHSLRRAGYDRLNSASDLHRVAALMDLDDVPLCPEAQELQALLKGATRGTNLFERTARSLLQHPWLLD